MMKTRGWWETKAEPLPNPRQPIQSSADPVQDMDAPVQDAEDPVQSPKDTEQPRTDPARKPADPVRHRPETRSQTQTGTQPVDYKGQAGNAKALVPRPRQQPQAKSSSADRQVNSPRSPQPQTTQPQGGSSHAPLTFSPPPRPAYEQDGTRQWSTTLDIRSRSTEPQKGTLIQLNQANRYEIGADAWRQQIQEDMARMKYPRPPSTQSSVSPTFSKHNLRAKKPKISQALYGLEAGKSVATAEMANLTRGKKRDALLRLGWTPLGISRIRSRTRMEFSLSHGVWFRSTSVSLAKRSRCWTRWTSGDTKRRVRTQ
ncbi:uncharacterized protein PV07_12621 [Cladophialophora immunda]|uniref:Uncharacterized protein n=1 Tax=Cladophialophora immunda TaxID=569365 RepID=A0A0D2CEL8_9EURO|nr:uncharacterized protein PV07_12621 [Cladophialophora immunda]KIW21974.1 hypothetical protein PV07_12621 [Cladophialophora immunda]